MVPPPTGQRTPFLWVAWTLPPTATGMAVVTRSLLRWFAPEECVMIGQVPYRGRIAMEGIENHRRIEIPSRSIYWRVKPYVEPFCTVPTLVREGCRAVKEHGLRAVIASYPTAAFLLGGYLIARRMGVPFFPYYHNLYVETRTNPVARAYARRLQRFLFSRAERVFSMSDGMSGFLMDRYRVASVPLVHAINHPIPAPGYLPSCERPFRIAFSGNINLTMVEPLRNVIAALGDDAGYEIVLHTPFSEAEVRRTLGMWRTNITVKDAGGQEELIASLRSCDVLGLALADMTGTHLEDDFRTQFPTRTLEMLVAERPILLLCPRHYFLAQFFLTRGCGYLLEGTDPAKIREAVDLLCTSTDERTRLVRNALEAAGLYRGERVSALLRHELSAAASRAR